LDEEALWSALQKLRLSHDLIIVDGNMLTELPTVFNLFHTVMFVTLDYETCQQRRINRTDYDPPDEIGYFDQVVWKCYEEHLEYARSLKDPRLEFMNGNDSNIYLKLLQMVIFTFLEYARVFIEEFLDKKCTV
jgi:uridine kinase